jgi:VWFA-related protein
MKRTMGAVVGVLALSVPSLPAQQGASQDRPVFRTAARLVELSVVVTDRERNPVSGLTADDFQIFDDDNAQKLEFFSIDGHDAGVAAPAIASPRRPGEFSNRVVDSGGVTIILFDQLNTSADARIRTRDHVVRFLQQIKPDDRVGLYVLAGDGTLRIVHDFSSDTASLVRAVARLRGNDSPALSGEEDGVRLDAALEEVLGSVAGETGGTALKKHFQGIRAEASIDALEAIGHHLSGIQKRKNLIWVSAGFPLEAFDYRGKVKTKEINRATRALNDANVALYTVDSRGLMPTYAGPPGSQSVTTLSTVAVNQDILQSSAEGTGGRAFLNTNDIHGAIRRATDDARMTYVLGYYPTNDASDGRFHRIRVKVNRPGLDVRHRKGYFAGATPQQAAAQRTAALKAAALSPIDANGLEMTLRIDPVNGTPADYRVMVRVDPAAIALEQGEGESRGTLDLIVAQLRADATPAGHTEHAVNIRLSGEGLQQFHRAGLTFDRIVTLAPDTERLRIVVRDVRTGAIGAIGITRTQLQAIPR